MQLSTSPSSADLEIEFDRQLATLLSSGYPAASGMDTEAFVRLVGPLRSRLVAIADDDEADLPFVIVPTSGLVPPAAAIALAEHGGRRGFTRMSDEELARFIPIAGVEVPDAPIYLVSGVDVGAGSLNVTPDEALPRILAAGRSPLTIDEAVAVVTQRPRVLRERNAFSVLGSRSGDRRVTAMWVSEGSPRLGWCWAGNPHSWLGSASCRTRLGPD